GTGLHALLAGWRTQEEQCCGIWTPDGRYYFFVGIARGRSNIWALRESNGLLSFRSSLPFQLTNGPMSLTFLTPSVDGKRLFVDGFQPRAELVRFDMKSRQFVPFLSGLSAGEVAFSADGNWIAYVSYPDGNLWRSKADGSERLQLTNSPVSAFLPSWSP